LAGPDTVFDCMADMECERDRRNTAGSQVDHVAGVRASLRHFGLRGSVHAALGRIVSLQTILMKSTWVLSPTGMKV
jgi:hypothetical protein